MPRAQEINPTQDHDAISCSSLSREANAEGECSMLLSDTAALYSESIHHKLLKIQALLLVRLRVSNPFNPLRA